MNTNVYPHELQFGDVYVTPVLIVVVIAFVASVITAMILNKTRVVRFFYATQYVFLAIMVLYIILIDRFWIRF